MLKKVVLGLLVVSLAWAYHAIQPLPPKAPYTPDDSSMDTRIKLRNGRHLTYKLYGVPKEVAKYKAIFIHSFGSSKYEPGLLSSEVILEELGVHLVSFDRPGYGKSDPHPKRTIQSIALDVGEVADQLGLGSKFHLIGYSMGGQLAWGCIKYIPERLAGVTLLAPAINYWWPGLPANLSKQEFAQQLPQDQWSLRVAHYAPWLAYWWNTQNWLPPFSVITGESKWNPQDLDIYYKIDQELVHEEYFIQQGYYESAIRDLIFTFGKWDFGPMDLKNPFPNQEGVVHLWQGAEDCLVPVALQRYIVGKLPWIQYHELPDSGHMFPYSDDYKDAFWKTMFKVTS